MGMACCEICRKPCDINDENPTHIIALDGAKLSSRWNQPE